MTVRVLYVNPWSSYTGGSSVVLLENIRRLSRRRFSPLVVCPEAGELPRRISELNVPVVIRRYAKLTRRSCARFLWDAISCRRFLRQRGVALIHLNGTFWRSSIALAAKSANVPYVVQVHNPLRTDPDGFVFRWASRILPVSDAVGKPLFENAALRRKTRTIHNAVPLDSNAGERPSEIEHKNGPLIGFVGQLVPRKGLDTLIRAMPDVLAACPRARLAVVGAAPHGRDEFEAECRTLAGRLGVNENVEFLGYRNDVPAWMRGFDVFALPTRGEGLVKVVLEAMGAGCPVVTTNIAGMSEIVRDASVGTLVPPNDPQAIAQAIISFLRDRSAARRVAEAARRHVEEHFGMEAMMRKLENVYDEVLCERSAREGSS